MKGQSKENFILNKTVCHDEAVQRNMNSYLNTYSGHAYLDNLQLKTAYLVIPKSYHVEKDGIKTLI